MGNVLKLVVSERKEREGVKRGSEEREERKGGERGSEKERGRERKREKGDTTLTSYIIFLPYSVYSSASYGHACSSICQPLQ